ncbi:MAG: GntR family transcriptional regulator [Oceanospirillaceae bacterium]|nr:GntR family transcriptional regulator [Oceanospirillaceae bacterium]
MTKKNKLSSQVFLKLRRMVLDNELKVGSYYLEQELAEQLGASRTPLREAAIRLEQEGLLEIVPRRGIFIKPILAPEMSEIYQVLSWLETAAITIACQQPVKASKIAELEAVADNMIKALENNDLDTWAENDTRFHQILVGLSNNSELIRLVNSYWEKTNRARMLTLRIRNPPVRSSQEHSQVIEALKKGDVEAAVKINSQHRSRASGELTDLLEVLNP